MLQKHLLAGSATILRILLVSRLFSNLPLSLNGATASLRSATSLCPAGLARPSLRLARVRLMLQPLLPQADTAKTARKLPWTTEIILSLT